MNDNEIIKLYFTRSEKAISETDKKYGAYCRGITYDILGSREDSEECVNDTYLKAWNTIPPQQPRSLGAFLSAIARNLALNLRRKHSTQKRGGRSAEAVYDELEECIPSSQTVEKQFDERELIRLINSFLANLGKEKQIMFMKRYYHFRSISEIAQEMGISEEKVKTTLHRVRGKLKKELEKEGIEL